ncbi:hypothetical protein BSG1_03945 [Bacillus sp. SG-1]|nr:hypothetical protein BSG1_03945 [Bacillus sp. SG-1]
MAPHIITIIYGSMFLKMRSITGDRFAPLNVSFYRGEGWLRYAKGVEFRNCPEMRRLIVKLDQ